MRSSASKEVRPSEQRRSATQTSQGPAGRRERGCRAAPRPAGHGAQPGGRGRPGGRPLPADTSESDRDDRRAPSPGRRLQAPPLPPPVGPRPPAPGPSPQPLRRRGSLTWPEAAATGPRSRLRPTERRLSDSSCARGARRTGTGNAERAPAPPVPARAPGPRPPQRRPRVHSLPGLTELTPPVPTALRAARQNTPAQRARFSQGFTVSEETPFAADVPDSTAKTSRLQIPCAQWCLRSGLDAYLAL